MLKLRPAFFAAAVPVGSLLFNFLLLLTAAVGQSRLPQCPTNVSQSYWDNCQGAITLGAGNYVGEWKHGKFDGQGTFMGTNGIKALGEFKDGELIKGTKIYPNREKYIGEFRDYKRNGQGTFTWANKNKYVGEWNDNLQNGQGTLFAPNGSIISSGIWADGKFVGTITDQETIRMAKSGGVYVVPVRFNETITLSAIVDSGASDVSIPADIVLTLMRTKTVSEEDFLGEQTYVLADGSRVPSQRFRIRSLKVGNKVIENVVASIASVKADILLGQSFLSKFKSWSVDNEQHTLILR